mmetsp:Transcript_15033/g.36375  ORF Transcript_15033/g.36375 Transcript_15033/m.36375 type:complete len:307 (-) Transcript_15033:11-931(-)
MYSEGEAAVLFLVVFQSLDRCWILGHFSHVRSSQSAPLDGELSLPPRLQQQLQTPRPCAEGCEVQGCGAHGVLCVGVRFVLQQHLHRSVMAVVSGVHKRHRLFDVGRIRIAPALQNLLEGLGKAPRGGKEHGRLPVLVRHIRIRADLYQPLARLGKALGRCDPERRVALGVPDVGIAAVLRAERHRQDVTSFGRGGVEALVHGAKVCRAQRLQLLLHSLPGGWLVFEALRPHLRDRHLPLYPVRPRVCLENLLHDEARVQSIVVNRRRRGHVREVRIGFHPETDVPLHRTQRHDAAQRDTRAGIER